MTKLNELLGEDLFKQVAEALKGKGANGKDISLVIDDGENPDVAALKAKIKTLEDEAAKAKKPDDKGASEDEMKDAAALKARIKALEDEAAAAKTTYEQERAKDKLNFEIEKALGNAKLKGTNSLKAVLGILDMEKIKLEGDKLQGLDDQVEALKKSDPQWFEPKNSFGFKGVHIAEGSPEPLGDAETEQWRKEAGLTD